MHDETSLPLGLAAAPFRYFRASKKTKQIQNLLLADDEKGKNKFALTHRGNHALLSTSPNERYWKTFPLRRKGDARTFYVCSQWWQENSNDIQTSDNAKLQQRLFADWLCRLSWRKTQ